MVIFLVIFVLGVVGALYFVMKPLTNTEAIRNFRFRPNLDFKGTRARNIALRDAKRKILADARRIHGWDLSDEERAAKFRSKYGNG